MSVLIEAAAWCLLVWCLLLGAYMFGHALGRRRGEDDTLAALRAGVAVEDLETMREDRI